MKFSLSLFLAVTAIGMASAASAAGAMRVLDPMTRIALRGSGHTGSKAAPAVGDNMPEPQRYVPMILKLADGGSIGELEAAGIRVLHHRDELVLAYIPADRTDIIEDLNIVRRASLGRPASALLDRAAAATGAASVIDGQAAELPYTGRGIVAGFSDIGFDPGHATFGGRTVGLSHINDTLAAVTRLTAPAEIAAYTTDNPRQYHATHVAGIMAGSGDGTPYRGTAPGADIYATTSTLYDTGILPGVEEIIAYARSHGQPAVINLSLGSAMGPRDGTDLFCQYLDRCAAEVPVLLSAGNDGSTNIGIHHTFSPEKPTLTAMVSEHVDWGYNYLPGHCEGWSSDERPFEVSFSVFDVIDRKFVYETGRIGGDSVSVIDATTDPAFARYYSGSIVAAGEVSGENGRYNLLMRLDLAVNERINENRWARHYLCVNLHGAAGTHVDFSPDGELLFLDPVGAAQALVSRGDNSQSISSMACGKNTICVGSATTRDSAPLLAGGTASWTDYVTAGTVSAFSSYGQAADGRRLPHFCAPGAYVVSAASRYWLNEFPAKMSVVNACGATEGNYFITDCGTSMASPHAAGIFALWLEADPTLTPAELLATAVETASTRGLDPADPRSGAGMIDAVAGLRKILRQGGLDLPEAIARPRVSRDGSRLHIDAAGLEVTAVGVYDLAGRTADADALPAGPVIVRVTTSDGVYTYKL